MRDLILAVAIVLTSFTPAPVSAACVGDCDGDGMVTIAELTNGIAIAVGEADFSVCSAFDVDVNQMVTVDELLRGVAFALHGCAAEATATVTPTDTSQLTPTPTPADRLLAALQEAFAAVCQPSQLVYVRSNEFGYSGYYGFCEVAAEHRSELRIEHFENIEDAATGVAGASQGPPHDFHEFPTAYWERGALEEEFDGMLGHEVRCQGSFIRPGTRLDHLSKESDRGVQIRTRHPEEAIRHRDTVQVPPENERTHRTGKLSIQDRKSHHARFSLSRVSSRVR